LTSIEFSFDPCNIYRDGPRGVGYPADARSVGDSAILLVHIISYMTNYGKYMSGFLLIVKAGNS